MSTNARRFRSIAITILAVAATNAAIAFASGVPVGKPDSPRPKTSGVPVGKPDSPRPHAEKTSGVPVGKPDSPRP
ncbi:MAG: hypothetical protein IPI01_02305 [Ignavibacteriae bacterium]|jgi:hypothetical protein|nr:hypothetical protein [Ignavibacteriota bacterium]